LEEAAVKAEKVNVKLVENARTWRMEEVRSEEGS
jgi:hypothetical protein